MIDVIPRPKHTPKLILVYAKMQALAEPARMLMNYAGLPYEDAYPWNYYGKPWREGGKQATPFGQVPVLVVDDHTSIDQSGSIQRYLATLTETCPADPLLAARADALCENAGELFSISNPLANFFKGDAFVKNRESFKVDFMKRLAYFDRAIRATPEGPFFLGTKPMYCDFTIFHHFQIAKLLLPNVFENHPEIEQFVDAMSNLAGLKDYLATRASLVDVGSAPVLMQDGVRIQPGFG